MGGRPPKCPQWFDIERPELTRPAPPPEQDPISASATPAPTPSPSPAPGLLGMFARNQPPADAPAAAPTATPTPPKPKRPSNFAEYLRDVGDVVHTGAVRVAANDDNTDFYMVPLTRKRCARAPSMPIRTAMC